MSLCPCGSQRRYVECCQPIHHDATQAQTPEQLMRARYSAHVFKLVDFVVATYHPSCHAELQRDAIAESIDSNWCQLEILNAPSTDNDEGFVEFQAYFNQDGEQYCLQERSRFVCEQQQWFYIDGEIGDTESTTKHTGQLKVGRNDPCPCGSGKKFKKCCA